MKSLPRLKKNWLLQLTNQPTKKQQQSSTYDPILERITRVCQDTTPRLSDLEVYRTLILWPTADVLFGPPQQKSYYAFGWQVIVGG